MRRRPPPSADELREYRASCIPAMESMRQHWQAKALSSTHEASRCLWSMLALEACKHLQWLKGVAAC